MQGIGQRSQRNDHQQHERGPSLAARQADPVATCECREARGHEQVGVRRGMPFRMLKPAQVVDRAGNDSFVARRRGNRMVTALLGGEPEFQQQLGAPRGRPDQRGDSREHARASG